MSSGLTVPLSQEERNCSPTRVLVTGASGYVGGHVVARLLAMGHTVVASMRHPDKMDDSQHLVDIADKTPGTLILRQADLLKEGDFDEAMRDCSVVFHVASPFNYQVPFGANVWRYMLDPAIKGTENVLGSVNRTDSVKRVILTSSVAAVYGDPHERGVNHVFSEADWNLMATPANLPYFYSKIASEERAYAIAAQQRRWDLITILPGQVLGPPLSPRTKSESVKLIKGMMAGGFWPGIAKLGLGVVDVRDVAAAHTRAMVTPGARGRYLCVSKSLWQLDWAKILQQKYPDLWLPFFTFPYLMVLAAGPYLGLPRDVIRSMWGKLPLFNSNKARQDLQLDFIDPNETILDMAESLLEFGLAKREPLLPGMPGMNSFVVV